MYLQLPIFYNFVAQLNYILEAIIVAFTPLIYTTLN